LLFSKSFNVCFKSKKSRQTTLFVLFALIFILRKIPGSVYWKQSGKENFTYKIETLPFYLDIIVSMKTDINMNYGTHWRLC